MRIVKGFARARFATVCALIACFGCCGAALSRSFIEIKTPYFTVVSAFDEKATRELVDRMRAFQATIGLLTNVKDLTPQVPLRIYLIDDRDWRSHVTPDKYIDGIMIPRPLSFVAIMNGGSWFDASRVLFHEYVHFALRNRFDKEYPRWFDEGFAEVLATFDVNKGKFSFGATAVDRLEDLGTNGGAHWVPLLDLLEDDWESSAGNDRLAHAEELGFYAESWALVHYVLFEIPDGQKALPQYIQMRWQGVAIEDAFARAFKMPVAAMESLLKKYVNRDRFKYYSGDVASLSLPSYGFDPARTMTPSESTLEFGNVVALMNPPEFYPYFESLTKKKGASAVAFAAKANALALLGQFDDARALIAKILKSNPTEREVFFLSGDTYNVVAELKTDATEEERRDLRKTAFEFYDQALKEPYSGSESLETISIYATYALQTHERLDRALMQIEHVRKQFPTQPRIASLHAQLLLALDRPEEAYQAQTAAADHARGRDQIEALEALEKIEELLRKK